jgi:hypothetical protein
VIDQSSQPLRGTPRAGGAAAREVLLSHHHGGTPCAGGTAEEAGELRYQHRGIPSPRGAALDSVVERHHRRGTSMRRASGVGKGIGLWLSSRYPPTPGEQRRRQLSTNSPSAVPPRLGGATTPRPRHRRDGRGTPMFRGSSVGLTNSRGVRRGTPCAGGAGAVHGLRTLRSRGPPMCRGSSRRCSWTHAPRSRYPHAGGAAAPAVVDKQPQRGTPIRRGSRPPAGTRRTRTPLYPHVQGRADLRDRHDGGGDRGTPVCRGGAAEEAGELRYQHRGTPMCRGAGVGRSARHGLLGGTPTRKG